MGVRAILSAMLLDPFALLRPFDDLLQVAVFAKEDDIRGDAAAAAALGASGAAGVHQVHGNRVIIVDAPSHRTEKADGILTRTRDLALCIRWADCQNFVLFCPAPLMIGVLHVGWRGMEAKTIAGCFQLLRQWNIRGEDVYVGAGPSLCAHCAEFTDPTRELPSVDPDLIDGRRADLQAAATREFLRHGVLSERIDRHPDCTRCHPELYWTYRGGHREQVQAGHTNMLACTLR